MIDPLHPEAAPKRPDLGFLSHRGRVRTRPVDPPQTVAAVADFVASRGEHPVHHGSAGLDLSAPASTGLDLSAPASTPAPAAASSSLDLSAPPARPAATPSASLDLSGPPASPTPSVPPLPAGGSLLDLSPQTAPASARPAVVSPPSSPNRPARTVARVHASERVLLSPKQPTVTLDRLQSAIGVLTFEAAASEAVGDLRIGAAYDLVGGHTSTVQRAGGAAQAPRDSRRPVILARQERFDRLTLDLRQNHELQRLVIYGFSESGRTLQWGGTLTITGLGDARVELPLDLPPSGGVTMFLSLYNVGGEFVLRAEMENVNGSVRDACRAYGFDRISWLDDRTPVS